MIVLDASAVVEMLIGGPWSESLREEVANCNDAIVAPHLLDIEVISALRSLASGKRIDPYVTAELLSGLTTLPIRRYAHAPLFERIWELRHNFTAYDGAYIALAEQLDALLYTCDEKLVKGHRARVRLFA